MPSASELAELLKSTSQRVVFAESCTAGYVAATLAAIPGASDFLCGSMAAYRNSSKEAWLNVRREDILSHTHVSETVAIQMALGVLHQTPEADVAVSITGHFGPAAPHGLDGVVFIATAFRHEDQLSLHNVIQRQLRGEGRLIRREEATDWVIREAAACVRVLRQRAGHGQEATAIPCTNFPRQL